MVSIKPNFKSWLYILNFQWILLNISVRHFFRSEIPYYFMTNYTERCCYLLLCSHSIRTISFSNNCLFYEGNSFIHFTNHKSYHHDEHRWIFNQPLISIQIDISIYHLYTKPLSRIKLRKRKKKSQNKCAEVLAIIIA